MLAGDVLTGLGNAPLVMVASGRPELEAAYHGSLMASPMARQFSPRADVLHQQAHHVLLTHGGIPVAVQPMQMLTVGADGRISTTMAMPNTSASLSTLMASNYQAQRRQPMLMANILANNVTLSSQHAQEQQWQQQQQQYMQQQQQQRQQLMANMIAASASSHRVGPPHSSLMASMMAANAAAAASTSAPLSAQPAVKREAEAEAPSVSTAEPRSHMQASSPPSSSAPSK